MLSGTVKWFSAHKQIGFIISDGKEYFVHGDNVDKTSHLEIKEGKRVLFDTKKHPKGPVAINVSVCD